MTSLMRMLAVALLAVALPIFGAAQAETVKVGISAEPYPPFASPDASGKWTGWEIEITDAICKAAKLDCEIVPVSWDGIIPALTSHKIDAIFASMSITPERMQTIDFSDKYYNTPAAVIGPKAEKFAATPEALKGKTVGVQVATIHENYAKKYFTGSQIKSYQTQDEANQDLVAGRLDAVQADLVALETFLESSDGKACCDLKGEVKPDLKILGPGAGAGLRKGEGALKSKINAAIKQIRSDGTYDKISKPYFNFDIYGK
jgi:polar amino acid transport system substrate-binding protein